MNKFLKFPNANFSKEDFKNKIPQTAEQERLNESVRKFSLSMHRMRAEETKIRSMLFIFRKNKLPSTSVAVKIQARSKETGKSRM